MAPPPKRRKIDAVEELVFNPEARQDFLTGFHKRKVRRTNHARELAQKRDREDRIRERKEIRLQRKNELEQHVAEVNALLKKQIDSSDDASDNEQASTQVDDDWQGFAEEATVVDGIDEYIDEGKYTTVTVKELDDVRDFESESDEPGDEDDPHKEVGAEKKTAGSAGRKTLPNAQRRSSIRAKDGDKGPKKKKKKRDFRYESKLERQIERKKQKLKNTAAAKTRKGK